VPVSFQLVIDRADPEPLALPGRRTAVRLDSDASTPRAGGHEGDVPHRQSPGAPAAPRLLDLDESRLDVLRPASQPD